MQTCDNANVRMSECATVKMYEYGMRNCPIAHFCDYATVRMCKYGNLQIYKYVNV